MRAVTGPGVTPGRPLHRLAAAFLLVLLPLLAAAQAGTRADQLAAMRLPTLAERIAKLHAQAGLGLLGAKSRRALVDAIRDFDSTLRQATAAARGTEARENYVLLGLLWPEYRDWALRPATRGEARKMRERSEEVVWVAAKGARMMQENNRGGASAAMVRAAQGALLSQRIPKLYLWRRWELRDEALAKELREARQNLPRALEALATAPENTPDAAAELQLAQNQWRFMDDAMRSLDEDQAPARHLEFIAKTGDNILESMERLARIYAQAK
jgi:hypothetical protein